MSIIEAALTKFESTGVPKTMFKIYVEVRINALAGCTISQHVIEYNSREAADVAYSSLNDIPRESGVSRVIVKLY